MQRPVSVHIVLSNRSLCSNAAYVRARASLVIITRVNTAFYHPRLSHVDGMVSIICRSAHHRAVAPNTQRLCLRTTPSPTIMCSSYLTQRSGSTGAVPCCLHLWRMRTPWPVQSLSGCRQPLAIEAGVVTPLPPANGPLIRAQTRTRDRKMSSPQTQLTSPWKWTVGSSGGSASWESSTCPGIETGKAI